MSRIETIGDATLYLGDCRDILPTLARHDTIITDPPYPDYHAELYRFDRATIDLVLDWIGGRRAFVFWSAKVELGREHTAIHIWDKKTGVGSEYERIYELNGQRNYKVVRCYLINSTVAASYVGDVFTGHPSQKPERVIAEILSWLDDKPPITDPFMGSGTTGVACVRLGRKFTGIEVDSEYFDIACRRIEDAHKRPDMFVELDRRAAKIQNAIERPTFSQIWDQPYKHAAE